MKLYVLKPTNHPSNHKVLWVVDCRTGFVIRAESEERARALASKEAFDEGADVWLEPERSTCEIVLIGGKEEIIFPVE